jgi:hypothetical protein
MPFIMRSVNGLRVFGYPVYVEKEDKTSSSARATAKLTVTNPPPPVAVDATFQGGLDGTLSAGVEPRCQTRL